MQNHRLEDDEEGREGSREENSLCVIFLIGREFIHKVSSSQKEDDILCLFFPVLYPSLFFSPPTRTGEGGDGVGRARGGRRKGALPTTNYTRNQNNF